MSAVVACPRRTVSADVGIVELARLLGRAPCHKYCVHVLQELRTDEVRLVRAVMDSCVGLELSSSASAVNGGRLDVAPHSRRSLPTIDITYNIDSATSAALI